MFSEAAALGAIFIPANTPTSRTYVVFFSVTVCWLVSDLGMKGAVGTGIFVGITGIVVGTNEGRGVIVGIYLGVVGTIVSILAIVVGVGGTRVGEGEGVIVGVGVEVILRMGVGVGLFVATKIIVEFEVEFVVVFINPPVPITEHDWVLHSCIRSPQLFPP